MHPVVDSLIRALIANAADHNRRERTSGAKALDKINRIKRDLTMNKKTAVLLDSLIASCSTPKKANPRKPAKAQDAAARRRKPSSGKVKNQVFNIIGTTRGRAMDESYSLALGRKPNEVANVLKGL